MRKLSLLLIISLTVLGCSDDTEPTNTPDGSVKQDKGSTSDTSAQQDGSTAKQDTGEADAAAAQAEFGELEPYSVLKGTATIKVTASGTITKIELLLDGVAVASADTAPYDLSWDTTGSPDGLAKLSLKVYAPAGDKTSEEVPAIVLNEGIDVLYKAGGTSGKGTMVVPDPPEGDLHLKHHWDMPGGITKMISILTWENPAFEMDLALGVGTCPHSGEEAAREGAKAPPIVIELSAPAGKNFTECQWFAHLGCTNETAVAGQETKYLVKTYLLK